MNERGQATSFDEWIGQASVEALAREVEEKEEVVNKLIGEMKDITRRAEKAHADLERRRKVLDVLIEIKPQHQLDASGAPELSKREMAMRILGASVRALFPREVRDAAVEKGWIENTPEASNQLTVAINKAFNAGKLARDEEGRYTVVRDASDQEQLLASKAAEAQE